MAKKDKSKDKGKSTPQTVIESFPKDPSAWSLGWDKEAIRGKGKK